MVRPLELVAAGAACTDRPREAVAAHRASRGAEAGRPLNDALCLHGLGVSPRHLAPLLRVLRRERPTVAPHLPQGVPLDRLAATVAARLRGPATVFANSLGCQIGVELAIRRPDLVRGLVLVGPTADPAAPTLGAHAARVALDTLREPPGLTWVTATDYLRNGPLRTLGSARLMLAHPMRERLPLVRGPVAVVRGARDPIVSERWAEEVARLLPEGRLIVIAGAAHSAHYTHPEQVAAIVP